MRDTKATKHQLKKAQNCYFEPLKSISFNLGFMVFTIQNQQLTEFLFAVPSPSNSANLKEDY